MEGKLFDAGNNGTNFSVFKRLRQLLDVEKTQTTPLQTHSDDMMRRFNRIIPNNLSLFVSRNEQDWDQKLPLFTVYPRDYRLKTFPNAISS